MIDYEKVISSVVGATDRKIDINDVSLETHFQDDLAFDSLSAMTLAVYIQEIFSLDISPYIEEYNSLQTIGELVSFLEQYAMVKE